MRLVIVKIVRLLLEHNKLQKGCVVMQNNHNFKTGDWETTIDVQGFIQTNYTPYSGDSSFLVGPTFRTEQLWKRCIALLQEEYDKDGVLDIDSATPTTIVSHKPGYIDQTLELIVGLQTDAPLKRAINPWGGIRMVETACQEYGYDLNESVTEAFTKYRRTHNDGVFKAYTPTMKLLRKSGVLTGLPDAYGRGRIIGDYRRVPLYGVDYLVNQRKRTLDTQTFLSTMTPEIIQLREEVNDQIQSLLELKAMAKSYGYDLSRPAQTSRDAVQWLYFAYLAAIKEQNGAAMSLGRVSSFLDIYFERDLKAGRLNEEQVQELVDDLVIKLRLARQLRTQAYNDLFSGDPNWITEAIGGMGIDQRPLVTKTSFRFLQTLRNLGPAPEPNMTVLWSAQLPTGFKQYCAQISLETCAIQYENDDLMRPIYGDDYGIACCVSAMATGKDIQYFGARANLPKALLLTLNGGRDEISGLQVAPNYFQAKPNQALDYDQVKAGFEKTIAWLAEQYVATMNVIHYMHDKYAYEKLEMALHDINPHSYMAFGMAGLSVIADSLSAIKYGNVTPAFNQQGLTEDFLIEGEFPYFGNNDPAVDDLAEEVVANFITNLRRFPAHRQAEHTLSILTITSNVVYGKKTGATPCGRKAGDPFAPGANPLHHRDTSGILASLSSVAKLDYKDAKDGISYTLSVTPSSLGKSKDAQQRNLVAILDGQFTNGGQHLNVNVLNRETLEDAMVHPEKYPQLTIRVSGYAVNFIKLTPEQQREVISRTIFQEGLV